MTQEEYNDERRCGMNNDLISRSELKKVIEIGELYWGKRIIDLIDNAPTVEPFEPDYVGKERLEARQRGYEEGYQNGMAIGKTLNPKIKKGEWIEKVERRGCFAGDKTVYSYTCPFCGVKEFKKYPFCHCGADMRKGGAE